MPGRAARMAASNAQNARRRGFQHRLAAVRALIELVKIGLVCAAVLVVLVILLMHGGGR